MQNLGCPAITDVEFDNMPATVQEAIQYLIEEHNKVALQTRPKSHFDQLSWIRAQWEAATAKGDAFFDDNGVVQDQALREKLMKYCEFKHWENLVTRVAAACSTHQEWDLLKLLRQNYITAQFEQQEKDTAKNQSKKKSKSTAKEKPMKTIVTMTYNKVLKLFAPAMLMNVRVACLTSLSSGEIGVNDIDEYVKAFQGKQLISNTLLDHCRYVFCDICYVPCIILILFIFL